MVKFKDTKIEPRIMKKIDETFDLNSLEILDWNKYRAGFLNR
jgi:hypothetical protein